MATPPLLPLPPADWRKRKSASGGFTLIEMLAVIAIVAILATILVPIISKARTAARQAESISRLGVCYKSIMLLSQDKGGALPIAYSTETDEQNRPYGTWQNQLVRDGYIDVPRGTTLTMLATFGCNEQLSQFPQARTKVTFGMNGRIGNVEASYGARGMGELITPAGTMLLGSGIASADGTSFNAGVFEDYARRVRPVFADSVLILYADGNVRLVPVPDIPTVSYQTPGGRRFWYGN